MRSCGWFSSRYVLTPNELTIFLISHDFYLVRIQTQSHCSGSDEVKNFISQHWHRSCCVIVGAEQPRNIKVFRLKICFSSLLVKVFCSLLKSLHKKKTPSFTRSSCINKLLLCKCLFVIEFLIVKRAFWVLTLYPPPRPASSFLLRAYGTQRPNAM
jgi:hypothetical protein